MYLFYSYDRRASANTPAEMAAEVRKDRDAGLKWLQGFRARSLSLIAAEERKVKAELSKGYGGGKYAKDVLDRGLREAIQAIEVFAATGSKESTYFERVSYHWQEIDDPENYADGQPRKKQPIDDLVKLLDEREKVAQPFPERLFKKYFDRLDDVSRGLPAPQKKAVQRAFFDTIGDGLTQKDAKVAFGTYMDAFADRLTSLV